MSSKSPVRPIPDVPRVKKPREETQATVPAFENSQVTLNSYASDICKSGHDFFHAESILLVCYTQFNPSFGYDIYNCKNCRKEEYRILSREGFGHLSEDISDMGYFTLH